MLTAVIINYGWRLAFVSLLVVGLLWSVLWAVLGKEGSVAGTASVHAPQGTVDDEPRLPYRRLFLNGTWLGGFLAGFAAYWALAVLTAWIPAYLQTVLGYDARTAGNLVVAPWIALAVATLGQGAVTDRLMRRGVSSRVARGVIGGVAVLAAGAAMAIFPLAPPGWPKITLLTLAFSLGGVIFALGVTVNAEISPTRQRAAVLSTTIGLVTTAGLLAPYVTGRVIEAADTPAAGYNEAFAIAAALLLAGGLLALLLVRPEHTARRLGLRPPRSTPTSTSTRGEPQHGEVVI